jgi:hypothetical protein
MTGIVEPMLVSAYRPSFVSRIRPSTLAKIASCATRGIPSRIAEAASNGLSRDGRELLTVQVRRTSDGQVTGTVPALPAGWTLNWSVSATADDRTFIIAAANTIACPSSTPTQTRFYRFNVTSTGHVTGLRAVGQPVTGEAVSEFAASPDGTKVAYAEQGCAGPASAAMNTGVIYVMNLTSGAVRSRHSTVSADPGPGHDPDRGVVLDGQRPHPGRRLSVESGGKTCRPGCSQRPEPGRGAGKRVQPVPANAGNGELVPPLARAITG